ncbi:hypothetical protein CDAR_289181 [Caerostris darwini]|uniref:Uncharacterized protein n=1 Tax=Caerostris darwini TaxID=1538125 RepID=A0AAV4PF64_9ARAC|nr:hypothetical protein CDAR_289181 [Caerostris darwini]
MLYPLTPLREIQKDLRRISLQKPVPRLLRESDRTTMAARSITERDFWRKPCINHTLRVFCDGGFSNWDLDLMKPEPRLRESDRITIAARSITERDFWLSRMGQNGAGNHASTIHCVFSVKAGFQIVIQA